MAEWCERVVTAVTPDGSLPVLAIDPEGFLNLPEIKTRCMDSGFTVIMAKPGLSVRVQFELMVRNKKSVILAVQGMYKPLPDIQLAAQVVAVSLTNLFPYLDAKALSGLGYNALCTLDSIKPYQTLGYDGTIRFLLENLYHVDIAALTSFKTRERVLVVLAETLYHNDEPNSAIRNYLHQLSRPFFGDKTDIVIHKKSLTAYLESAWKDYHNGNTSIDFTDPMLNRTINTLFINGDLPIQNVTSRHYNSLPKSLRCGFRIDKEASNYQRITELLQYIEDRIPVMQDQYHDWFSLAPILGELGYLVYDIQNVDIEEQFRLSVFRLNQRFQHFIRSCYWSLHSLSGSRYPITIHKILDFIHAQNTTHRALFVIDGMNLWQWWILKTVLQEKGFRFQDKETPSFAWLPSITAWSRQALFRGAKPDLTRNNSKEASLFQDYWLRKNLLSYQIHFGTFETGEENLFPSTGTLVAAYICNDLDDLMHGSVMGNRQLSIDTKEWVTRSGVADFLHSLTERGFTVYITTDHGNIEADSMGTLPASVRNLSTSRSKRHIQFVDSDTARKFVQDHPDYSLGCTGNSIYLTDENAFTSSGTVVTHGGSHILELIIPLGVLH